MADDAELPMRQSASLSMSNQTKATTSGWACRNATRSVSHSALDPPTSDDAVSAMMIGLPGATARSR